MIDMINGVIRQGEQTEKLVNWAVWFWTPQGLATSLPEAVQLCQELEIDPRVCVPCCVAVGEGHLKEVVVQGVS